MVVDVSYRAVVNSKNITRSVYFSHGFSLHTSCRLQFTKLPSLSQAGNEARLSAVFPRTLIANFGDIDLLGYGFTARMFLLEFSAKKKSRCCV